MLRVNSSSVLVVPPLECAWLSGQEVSDESCCISFDVKGAAYHPSLPARALTVQSLSAGHQ